MFPTAALLVALRLGACPDGYTRHIHIVGLGTQDTQTLCCGTELPEFSNIVDGECYVSEDPDDRCKVSEAAHRCCAHVPLFDEGHNTYTVCFSYDEARCKAVNVEEQSDSVQWCPLLTKEEPPLSSGAIGGIVVGAYLGVAAIGGAAAAYRGSHNYGTAAGV